jgi:hypothetical protein
MNRQQVYNMPLVVAPSFNFQFITFCIMYVSLPPSNSPLAYQNRTNETAQCHGVFALKLNVSVEKGAPEVHVTRPRHPTPRSMHQSESRMNKQGESRSWLYPSACNQVHTCIPCWLLNTNVYIHTLDPVRHCVVLTVKQVLLLWRISERQSSAAGSVIKVLCSQPTLTY